MMTTKTLKPTNGEMTADEMKQAIAADQTARAKQCAEKVNALLKQYDCEFLVLPQLTPDGRITATATIKAR